MIVPQGRRVEPGIRTGSREVEIKELRAKIGELVIERVFVQGLRSLSHGRRVTMVDPKDDRLSITRQCRLVSIAWSSFYYEGRGESPLNLRLMRLIDEQFPETPFYGSRQMTRWLRRQGYTIGRMRVRQLMRGDWGQAPLPRSPKQPEA